MSPQKSVQTPNMPKNIKPKEFKGNKEMKLQDQTPAQFCIMKDDIKYLINGYGRIIEYATNYIDKNGNYNPTIDKSQNYVISVAEGHFSNCQFNGYVRCLDNEGECKVGFWHIDTTDDSMWAVPVSRPWGKFATYYKDGSFKSLDGIYRGCDDAWNYCQKQKPIRD